MPLAVLNSPTCGSTLAPLECKPLHITTRLPVDQVISGYHISLRLNDDQGIGLWQVRAV